MTYWVIEKECFVEEPIEGCTCLELSEDFLKNLYSDCVPGRDRILTGPAGYPVVERIVKTEQQLLEEERIQKSRWLRDHDYIGTKIATGRATIEDYADEIRTMREYAERIEEIDLQLGGQNEEAD